MQAFITPLPFASTVQHTCRNQLDRRCCPHRRVVCSVQPSPPLIEPKIIDVNAETGKKACRGDDPVPVVCAKIDLPTGPVRDLVLESTPEAVDSDRPTTAAVWGLPSVLGVDPDSDKGAGSADPNWLRGARVIVFAHGFSQRPDNYASTLRRLAVLGYVIIAPRAWILSVIWPWVHVEQINSICVTRKLQTAVLIDVARSAQVAIDCGASELHLLGHSMGAAMALAYLPYTSGKKIKSTAVLAPAVKASKETTLNPYVHGRNEDNFDKLGASMPDSPLLILQGTMDVVVLKRITKKVFEALKDTAPGLVIEGLMERGTHIGFEDQLDVNLPWPDIVFTTLFLLIDFLAYGPIGDFLLDTDDQLEDTKDLLEAWFTNAGSNPDDDVAKDLKEVPVKNKVSFDVSRVSTKSG